jgi:hypothetical protein
VNPQDEIPFESTIKLKSIQERQESGSKNLDPLKSRFKNLKSNQDDRSKSVGILFQEPRFGANAIKGLPLISS